MSLQADLLQCVRNNPGITGTELRERFSEASRFSVSSLLGRLSKQKLIENRGPEGTRWSKWYPVEYEKVNPAFLEEAERILEELKTIDPSERIAHLARYLQKS